MEERGTKTERRRLGKQGIHEGEREMGNGGEGLREENGMKVRDRERD